jgi:outer membrane lipoprotein LolB
VRRTAAAVALSALLAACSTLQPAATGSDTLSGRLSVQIDPRADAPAKIVAGAFDLRGSAERGDLQITSPLGTVIAQAQWRPGEVRLKSSEGERRFANLDALADEVFGEPLPLAALFDWLHGRPWAGAPSKALTSPAQGFEQMGWSVGLERFGEGLIVARRAAPPSVTVRAKLTPAS